MWFEYKKRIAPIYQDETYRRLFATASGRNRRKALKKKMKNKDPNQLTGWRRLFGRRSKSDSTGRAPTPPL